ncbi:MAG TPA: hypothetical protein VG096_20955 [Bryobacteraceae bacterium]|jgi:hypothetical protein|nr:hypothetical protein [Bryobacteraceae bacterium]
MEYNFNLCKVREALAVRTLTRIESVLRSPLLWGAAMAVLSLVPVASADMIDGSTGTGAWTVSGAGATNATADVLGSGAISFTSNGRRTGTFVNGASLAAFDGYWTASFTFFLPSTATDVSGSFSNLFADDRVVLFFNGNEIGDGGIGIPASGSVAGQMELTDGGGDQPFTFASSDSAGSGSGGFILGGVNTLLAVINNTGSGVTGTTKTFLGDGDGSVFRLQAEVTFAPEPAGLSTLVGGCLVALAWFRHRTRR